MFRMVPLWFLLVVSLFGCDINARQQRAEEVRRAAAVEGLKALGKSMHENQNSQSSSADTAKETPPDSDASKVKATVPPATTDSSETVENIDQSPSPTE